MQLAVAESIQMLSSRENFKLFFSCTTSEKTITINFPDHRLISNFPPYNTGSSKRNGAKLRESFSPAAASHSRPCQAGA